MQTVTDKQVQAVLVMGIKPLDGHSNSATFRAFWLVDGWAVRVFLDGVDRGCMASVRRPDVPREWRSLDNAVRHVRELQAWGGEYHFPIEVA